MTLKLDINKAYEYIEWNYLRHMLQVFGFHKNIDRLDHGMCDNDDLFPSTEW